MKIGLCCYKKESEAEETLILNIKNLLIKELKEDNFIEIYDLGIVESEVLDVCLCFGSMTKHYLPEHKRLFTVHSLKDMVVNRDYKKEAFSAIKELIEYVNSETTKQVVLEKDGVTFGKENAQILITDEEIKHLLKLKELLGTFDKIIITKGDLKVELEGQNVNQNSTN